ncbi:hypothetical protein DY218_01845 [Streptomyces triticagri]|uniref:DUF5709 domain-containing protein n=1 Tax=Streptomyces triticagri TaxID=2293568 RepID=A0A372MBZ6_9ACTN|nr:hypothetical protein [Streptomyces triticagri]RFU88426.1 hypothetical protein DY218_01845 [Streptomyces triticagri]
MTVDPSDPETFADENTDDTGADFDEQTPEADAAEQRIDLQHHRDEAAPQYDPASADPADVAEQARVVELDEDDYR